MMQKYARGSVAGQWAGGSCGCETNQGAGGGCMGQVGHPGCELGCGTSLRRAC